jgi:UrcA family protein
MMTKLILPAALLMMLLPGASPVEVRAGQAADEEVVDRIRVVAPRVTRTSRGAGRYEVATAERSDYVYYGDLDLTRTADLFELQDRVREIATEVCTLLTEMFPRGSPSTETCIQRAVDDASVLVDAAVRAAIARQD